MTTLSGNCFSLTISQIEEWERQGLQDLAAFFRRAVEAGHNRKQAIFHMASTPPKTHFTAELLPDAPPPMDKTVLFIMFS